MSYGEDLQKTREELGKLGPKAVQVLAKRLEGSPGQGDDVRLAAAQEVLDRLEIRRSSSGTPR